MSWEFKCPSGWYVNQKWGDGYACLQNSGGLRVIIDCEPKSDGKEWIHVSVSRKSWTPSHEDMALVKRDFIGDLYAYSVWPPREVYVNIHNHCLHLWALADNSDGRVLPEFRAVLEGIGRSV